MAGAAAVRARVGIVHGDVDGLAGWQLGVEAMSPPDEALRAALGCADTSDASTYLPPTPRETVLEWCAAASISGDGVPALPGGTGVRAGRSQSQPSAAWPVVWR